VSSTRVSLSGPRGEIRYEDTVDHFENGLLRLLELDPPEFLRWLELSELASGELFERLRTGFAALRPSETVDAGGAVEPGPGGVPGQLWHAAIGAFPNWGVARSADGALGWLVRREGERWVRECEPPQYEQAYYEGDPSVAGGYGGYAAQSDWRIEKAHRQVRELIQATALGTGRVLDMGSGYGFFRHALEAAGFAHDGLEPSRHAREAARTRFGFETFAGTLGDHARGWRERYDAVTLWDVIEHVAEPVELLKTVSACLKTGGIVALKTPNLDCPEAEIFGPRYHSLKREHLAYFTPASLEQAAAEAGLTPLSIGSTSHLLNGFIGEARTRELATARRGADLVAYLHKA
jgi:2-polyprenyl-3-methyl-5-hydroxy-6-metoxy-1,4-benzoquinol methylase